MIPYSRQVLRRPGHRKYLLGALRGCPVGSAGIKGQDQWVITPKNPLILNIYYLTSKGTSKLGESTRQSGRCVCLTPASTLKMLVGLHWWDIKQIWDDIFGKGKPYALSSGAESVWFFQPLRILGFFSISSLGNGLLFFSTKEPDAHLQAIEGRPVEPWGTYLCMTKPRFNAGLKWAEFDPWSDVAFDNLWRW